MKVEETKAAIFREIEEMPESVLPGLLLSLRRLRMDSRKPITTQEIRKHLTQLRTEAQRLGITEQDIQQAVDEVRTSRR